MKPTSGGYGPKALRSFWSPDSISRPHFTRRGFGIAESAGPAGAQLVPPTEEPPNPRPHVPADSTIGLARKAKAEVLSPPRQESVEPLLQLGPGCWVSPEQQGVDLFLEPLLGFFEGRAEMNLLPERTGRHGRRIPVEPSLPQVRGHRRRAAFGGPGIDRQEAAAGDEERVGVAEKYRPAHPGFQPNVSRTRSVPRAVVTPVQLAGVWVGGSGSAMKR